MAAFEFTLRKGLEGLGTLETEWTELFAANQNRAFYNDWRWHAAIARHLIESNLHFLQVTDRARTIAIFPLQINKKGRSRGFVTFPRHPHIVLNDAVVDPAYLDVPLLDSVAGFIQQHEEFRRRRLVFSSFADRSNFARLCESAGIPARIVGKSFVARFATDGVKTELSRKQIRSIERSEAKAQSVYGTLDASFISDPANILAAFETFMNIERSGWKGSEGTDSAIGLHPSLIAFYRELLCSFSRTGQASIGLLRLGDRYVAAHIALLSGSTAYSLKIAYDEAYSKVSPGHILRRKLLEQLASNSLDFNMTTGPEWAEVWHFDREYTHEVAMFRCKTATVGAYRLRRFLSWAKAKSRVF
jgi:CelD/BcsL family acetyltransferase involved in cellulose biosynthesis